MDNIYTAPTIMATWDVNPPEVAPATNIITDCGMYSPNQFVNGNFDRVIRFPSCYRMYMNQRITICCNI